MVDDFEKDWDKYILKMFPCCKCFHELTNELFKKVLASMWKHKNLHDLLKKDGYKETDFTSVAKQMGLKSSSSSPANTLHRPRGDVNVKPSHHGGSQKSRNLFINLDDKNDFLK